MKISNENFWVMTIDRIDRALLTHNINDIATAYWFMGNMFRQNSGQVYAIANIDNSDSYSIHNYKELALAESFSDFKKRVIFFFEKMKKKGFKKYD